ncbi:MAG: DUF1217 domain-containing protein [Hyphomicrobiales bacterium]|nr:DUF1217 domain-containing protein [Hyphomicrobiales bacterium]
MQSAAASYRFYAQNLPAALSRVSAQPQVGRDTAYYLAKIETVKTVDEFVNDRRLFGYAMKAFGLESMTFAKAFMRKALEGGVDDSASFANQLADRRYRDFVETFNFARYGETATVFDRARQGVVDRYVRQTLEEQAGQRSDAARLALYFERRAPEITSPYQLLADSALTKVAQTLAGLPASTSALDIDKQAEMLKARLPIADFKDPEKLQRLVSRFVNLSDAQSEPQTGVNALLARGTGVDQNLFFTLQSLRRGGV